MSDPIEKKHEKKGFLETMTAILWSFIGLRRRSDYEQDAHRLNPFYVLLAALIAGATFVGGLLLIISIVVK